jgi:uncharacterized protein (UPF0210 family)
MLEDMGWKIYRAGSTDWIKDQHTEDDGLLSAIKEAIDTCCEVASSISYAPTAEMSDFDVSAKSAEEIVCDKYDSIRSRYSGI